MTAGTDADAAVLPLAGLRVLDFTRHMAGPLGTVVLSDFGADVIKIESLGGDPSRRTGLHFVEGESALFFQWNRGKRSIALDLRTDEGKDVVRRLVREADVVVENYRPGQADQIGIGYDALSAINPRLLYCSVSAFGTEAPLAPFPGTDPVVQAASGVMSVTGEPDRGPSLVGIPIADFAGAMLCVQAVTLGVIARERTGRGQRIDVSMLYGLLSSLTTRLASFWATGEEPGRFGSAHSVVVPYEAFRTADGFVVAGVWGGNDGWGPFCEAVGLPHLAEDPRYDDNESRVRLRAELKPLLDARFAERTTAEWAPEFRSRGVLFHPVFGFGDIMNHEQVAEAGIVQTVDHPVAGPIKQVGPVIRMSDTPGRIASPPPLLGQHTREVLDEAGYDASEVQDLLDTGVAREDVRGVGAARSRSSAVQ